MSASMQMVVMLIGLGLNFVAVMLTSGGILFALFKFAALTLERLARVETMVGGMGDRMDKMEKHQERVDTSMHDFMQTRGMTPRRSTIEG